MKKVIDFIYNVPITKFCSSVLMLGLAIIMTLNVILRYFFHFSFNWSDEILRYISVYMSFMGIVAGWRYSKHISITVITEHLVPEKARKYFRLLSDIAAIIFMSLVTSYGFILAGKVAHSGQSSPALHLPMVFIYGVVPVCGVLSIIQILLQIFKGKTYLESRE